MNFRYALDALRRNLTNPHWYQMVFNNNVAGPIHMKVVGNDGEYVVEQDWDNLILLDGCRYDLFETVYRDQFRDRIKGDLRVSRSRGSGSPEFLRENFQGRELDDTVYVTANPFVVKVLDDPFYYVDHVWKTHWDDELETVRPASVVEKAKRATQRFPHKRLIVHFMQPHHPFIGDTRLDKDRGFVGAIAKSTDQEVPDAEFVWERLRRGSVDYEEVWDAYKANLVLALEHAENLIGSISGKHVITSDHGNAFGERFLPFPTKVYGHGKNLRLDALVNVPWLVIESENRREISTHEGREAGNRDLDDTVDDRLESLGYKV